MHIIWAKVVLHICAKKKVIKPKSKDFLTYQILWYMRPLYSYSVYVDNSSVVINNPVVGALFVKPI